MKNYILILFLVLLSGYAVHMNAGNHTPTDIKHIIPDSIANRSFGELLAKFGNKQKYKYWQCMSCFGIAEQYYDGVYMNGHPIVAEWGDSARYRSMARKELHTTWFHYSHGDGDPSGYYIAAIDSADNLIYIDTDEKFLSFISHNTATEIIALQTALNNENFEYSVEDSAYVYYENESIYYFFGTTRSSRVKCSIDKDLKKFSVQSLDFDKDKLDSTTKSKQKSEVMQRERTKYPKQK